MSQRRETSLIIGLVGVDRKSEILRFAQNDELAGGVPDVQVIWSEPVRYLQQLMIEGFSDKVRDA